MEKPLKYVYCTAAGTFECQRTEDQIREHRANREVTQRAEGRLFMGLRAPQQPQIACEVAGVVESGAW